MNRLLRSGLGSVDRLIARASLAVARERPALITLLFHSLFIDADEIERAPMDPQQGITVAQLAMIIECLQARGYQFISPRELLAGLRADGYYAMVTFDDGYYNNLRALDVLGRLNAPATFFISTGHVKEGKCFWWDVLYRERLKQRESTATILAEGQQLKARTAAEIDEYLLGKFGPDAFQPSGELDRPMTVNELRELARHPHAHIGNHTRDHAILTNYDARNAQEQISHAQDDLAEMVGAAPVSIAYPNGNYSAAVIEAVRRAGLHIGITVEETKNRLPLEASDERMLRLGRFTPWGNLDIGAQATSFRAGFSLTGIARRTFARS